jgi:hypothetical protein
VKIAIFDSQESLRELESFCAGVVHHHGPGTDVRVAVTAEGLAYSVNGGDGWTLVGGRLIDEKADTLLDLLDELTRLRAVVAAVSSIANRPEEPFATHPRSEAHLIDEINDALVHVGKCR